MLCSQNGSSAHYDAAAEFNMNTVYIFFSGF